MKLSDSFNDSLVEEWCFWAGNQQDRLTLGNEVCRKVLIINRGRWDELETAAAAGQGGNFRV